MGTADFSLPSLRALHDNRYNIVGVITQPDRKSGRGRKIVPPPVKRMAQELGYRVFQPEKIRDEEWTIRLRNLKPDLFIVVAYGHILTQELLSVPLLGAINVHGSLLPKYRGPAPVQWAIINGEKYTGVTTIWMDSGVDTGDILVARKIPIEPEDTSLTLHERLARLGAEVLIETLEKLKAGTLTRTPQDHTKATYAPLLKKEDGYINWNLRASEIVNFVRGMTPWPGAFTLLSGKRLRVFRAEAILKHTAKPPGTVLGGSSKDLHVATGDGILALKEVQLASGKRLLIADFLRGHSVSPDTVLG